MPALRVHEHCIDCEWVTLPFVPETFRAPWHINRVSTLEHEAFDRRGISACAGLCGVAPRHRQKIPGFEIDLRRKVDLRTGGSSNESFKPAAPFGEGEGAQILAFQREEIVSTYVSRII